MTTNTNTNTAVATAAIEARHKRAIETVASFLFGDRGYAVYGEVYYEPQEGGLRARDYGEDALAPPIGASQEEEARWLELRLSRRHQQLE